jgi:hypothetical protein
LGLANPKKPNYNTGYVTLRVCGPLTPNDSVPQHTSAAARAACATLRTELTMETFKNWTLRDRQAVVPLSKLERAKGRILLTTKTVIHLALMLRLTELGLKPSEAARIADVFTAAKGRWMVRSPA